MEADSRQWHMKCLKCDFEESYWDLGGVRWKATGDSKNLRLCPGWQPAVLASNLQKENHRRVAQD
jgi:hypothetical protein